jgi:hypothetical protein
MSGCRTRPRVPGQLDAGARLPELVGPYPDRMNLAFSGEMWFWKGPAPWHFITVPKQECGELEAASAFVTYGWAMTPVTAQSHGLQRSTAARYSAVKTTWNPATFRVKHII